MTYDEYLGWQSYFEARPVGWREDNRVMPLLQIKGVKAKPYELFPSLGPIFNPVRPADKTTNKPESIAATTSLKQSVLFSMMMGAAGGHKLEM